MERRAETNADTAYDQRGWLDRLFADTAAQRVGITFDAVPAGQVAYPYTNAGAAPVQRGRSQDIADAGWTIGVKTAEPSRHGARAVFNIEDAARVPMLESAISRDLRSALVESMDRAMFIGDANSDEDAIADITGLQTAPGVVENTVTQTAKLTMAGALGAFGDFIDGKHSASPEDLGIVLSVGSLQLWFKTPANTGAATSDNMLSVMRSNGLSFMSREGISTVTTANAFGAFVGRSRGQAGAGIAAVWESGELLRDPYTSAKSGQVALTLSALWNFVLPRPSNFGRIKFA